MKTTLKNKMVLLGVGGGIAAYKACEILRGLQEAGAEVHVVLTNAAQKFITPLTFQSLSQNPVHTDLFNLTQESEMSHIKLADEADLILIAPATADLMAKFAYGLADDLLSTLVLVTRAPVFLAPSMNVNMWEKEVVQNNFQILKTRGYTFIEPEEGYLACGWEGKGRLAHPDRILQALAYGKRAPAPSGKKKSLFGKKILITAGPTREYLDPVRFISNPSSGKMGFTLAEEAHARGAEVFLVSGPVNLATPPGVHRANVHSAEEMFRVCKKHFPKMDVFIATAAVGDFRSKKPNRRKIKKSSRPFTLELVPNRDILDSLSQNKTRGQILVGFAAETENLEQNARKKLFQKKLDLIIANDVSKRETGFESDYNQVRILNRGGGVKKLARMTKTEIAKRIFDTLESFLKRSKIKNKKP